MVSTEKISGIKSGLTITTFLAILYAVFVFQPAMVWLQLTTGGALGSISWITLLVFAEVARLLGRSITKQEATVIYLLAGVGGTQIFINYIWRAYYSQSPITKLFGLSDVIPSWWTSRSLDAWLQRTFFHESWYTPILIGIIFLILSEAVNISMGLITREVFIKSMKLPFPLQEMSATGIVTIVEPTEERRNVFLVGVIIAIIYGFILYTPPNLMQLLTGLPGTAPIPWADMNNLIQTILPGASLGIATSLLNIVSGFILPFNVVVSIFIGSIALNIVANHLLVTLHLTHFADEYFYGMTVAQVMYRSQLYAWAGPLVGVAIGAAIVPLMQNRRAIAQGFKSLARVETSGQLLSLPLLLSIWLAASVASVIIVYMLIPAGLLYLIVMLGFSLGWSFVWTMVDTYSYGITGLNLRAPNEVLPIFKYSYISLGLYKGADIWFIDPIVSTGGSGWCSTFKVLDLNETDIMSYLKAFVIILPIVVILNFIYTQNFWSIAPIPSILYQYTSIFWPISAVNTSLWITGKMFQAFDPTWIMGAFALTLGAGVVISLLKLPLSIIGIAAGLNTAIPYAVTIFIGAIVGKFIAWRFGQQWWNRNKMVFGAGIALGESLAVVILTTIGMMARALWVLPY